MSSFLRLHVRTPESFQILQHYVILKAGVYVILKGRVFIFGLNKAATR